MPKVCEKHWQRAQKVLRDMDDGTEYYLCAICDDELKEILYAKPQEAKDGRKRVPRSIKSIKK